MLIWGYCHCIHCPFWNRRDCHNSESPPTITLVMVHLVFWHMSPKAKCPCRRKFRAAGADIFDHLDGMLTFYNWVIHEETAAWLVSFSRPACEHRSIWVKIFKTQKAHLFFWMIVVQCGPCLESCWSCRGGIRTDQVYLFFFPSPSLQFDLRQKNTWENSRQIHLEICRVLRITVAGEYGGLGLVQWELIPGSLHVGTLW